MPLNKQLSHGLVSYSGHMIGWRFYPSAVMQSVYSTVPADWVIAYYPGTAVKTLLLFDFILYKYSSLYICKSFQERQLKSNLLDSKFTRHEAKPQITIPSSVFYL